MTGSFLCEADMNWEVFSYWFPIIFSGITTGTNPCALVVLWFFFVYLSKNARTPGMIACGGWIFLVVTFVTNIALIFGVLDPLLKQSWSPVLFLGSYGVISLGLAVQGILHFRDWHRYKFRQISVDQFKIPMPVFFHSVRKASAADWRSFVLKGLIISLILNFLGVAWGQDYALYISFSQIYFSAGVIPALKYLVVFFAGYLVPLVLLWAAIARWATFKGHENLPGYHVAFIKIFQMAVSLSIAVILGVMIARDFFNI